MSLNKIVNVGIVICLIGIIISGGLFIKSKLDYSKGNKVYDEILMSGNIKNKSDFNDKNITENINFKGLEEINKDIIGWIYLDKSKINYPIVKTDNNDYYLTHLFNKETNKLGSIFMDYRNNKNFSDKNTIIYGHNMKDGSMFSSITEYKSQKYYDEHKEILISIPDKSFYIEIFAGIIANGGEEFIKTSFKDDEEFRKYIEDVKKKSTFKSDLSVDKSDSIVTLCTCSYEFSNARYAIFGRVKPILK